MITYNQIVQVIKNISEAHLQVHSFGVGEIDEVEGSIEANRIYPKVWLAPVNSTVQENTTTNTFNLLCFDLVKKATAINQEEVLSDTQMILYDIIKVLKDGAGDDFDIVGEVNLTPFTEKFGDDVTGWNATITIEINFEPNSCDLPIDAFSIPSGDCSDCGGTYAWLTCNTLEGCTTFSELEARVTALENAPPASGYIDNIINVGETVTVDAGEQYFVYGNLLVNGTLINNGEVVIVNGALTLGMSGVFTNNGTINFQDLASAYSLTTEIADRAAGDAALQLQIDNLPPPATPTLPSVLSAGNTTSGNNIELSNNDQIVGNGIGAASIDFGTNGGNINILAPTSSLSKGTVSIQAAKELETYSTTLALDAITRIDITTPRQSIIFDESDNKLSFLAEGWFEATQNDGLGNIASIQFAGGDSYYTVTGSIEITSNNLTIAAVNSMKYATDYSSVYDNRSLVDKEYVDNAIASAVPTIDLASVLATGNSTGGLSITSPNTLAVLNITDGGFEFTSDAGGYGEGWVTSGNSASALGFGANYIWVDNTATQITSLAGTGTEMVVASSTGVLSRQAIPSLTGYQLTSQKNNANGYAGLDGSGKIFSSQLPSIAITDTFVVGSQAAMLALSTAETGDIAIRTDLNKSFILSGTYSVLADWKELLTPTDAVLSVNGQTGIVSLTTSNIAEGSNLYYTSTRFNTAFATKSTTDLTEGSNLYYTDARFDTRLATKSTTNLTEGSNLYFTNARAIGSTLTGYTSGAGTITSADSVLGAIQKLNGNISSRTLQQVATSGSTTNTDLEITDTTKGVILKSPDGTRWRITIDNTGNLISTSI